MKNNRYAAIDIGTNTFRLFIAEVFISADKGSPSFHELFSERIVTRLGEGISAQGLITEDAMERGLSALAGFQRKIQNSGVLHTAAIATGALREADNSGLFIQKARETSGIDIRIISGDEEARLSASGMLVDMDVPSEALMTDIGGGSTELIFAREGNPAAIKSINLGVVYLTAAFMADDPPSPSMLKEMESEISGRLQTEFQSFHDLVQSDTSFIGTAGTITTLSAISQNLSVFDHESIHNSSITGDSIRDVYLKIASLSTRERARYIPFEPARLDIIVPGTFILLKLMELFHFRKITVSNYGLREGIVLDMFHRHRK